MPNWKRNLYATWLAQVFSLAGFGFMFPFIPYFLQELGVTDPTALKVWVGVYTSIPSLVLAIVAPIWGILADRFGRKIMVLRAILGGAIFVALMSVATGPGMVLTFRIMIGVFAGSVPASATLVAAGTPKEHISRSLGFLSTSTFIGISIGPLIGGFTAELVGYRLSFLVGAAVMLAGFILVLLLVEDVKGSPIVPGNEDPDPRNPAPEFSWRKLLAGSAAIVFVTLFLVRFSQMLPGPFVPLYVQELLGGIEGASLVSGGISAATGAATALAGVTLVRLGDRHSRRRLVSVFLAAAALLALPIFFVRSLPAFAVLYVATIYFMGAVEPTLQAHLSSITPASRRGAVFGIHTTVASLGWFVSPLVASGISIGATLRHVFLAFCLSLASTCVVISVANARARRREQVDFTRGS